MLPPLKNCTWQQHQLVEEQYGSPCQEGYCRVIPPERVFCQCYRGWRGELCDLPDVVPVASAGSYGGFQVWQIILVIGVIVFLAAVIGIAVILYVWKHKSQTSANGAHQGPQRNDPAAQDPFIEMNKVG